MLRDLWHWEIGCWRYDAWSNDTRYNRQSAFSAILLSVSVVLGDIVLCVIMLSVVITSAIRLSVIITSAIMLRFIMLSVSFSIVVLSDVLSFILPNSLCLMSLYFMLLC
jgi:hypothetical protein